MSSCFPNVTIALRLYLTLPVAVCEGERSFSRLVLNKNRLRSCLQQDKLNALAVLAMESDIVRDMSFDDVVSKFRRHDCTLTANDDTRNFIYRLLHCDIY